MFAFHFPDIAIAIAKYWDHRKKYRYVAMSELTNIVEKSVPKKGKDTLREMAGEDSSSLGGSN